MLPGRDNGLVKGANPPPGIGGKRILGVHPVVMDWLRENEEAAARMGVNGSNYVSQNFTWDRIFDQFAATLADWGLGVVDQDQ